MTTTTAPTTGFIAVDTKTSPWRAFLGVQRRFPIIQLLIAVIAFAIGAATLEGFASPNSIKSVLVLSALVALAGLGQTLVVMLGGFDMSVSSFIVFGAVMVTQVTRMYDISFELALLIAIVGALLLGAFVGWLCHRFSIEPLIATLAMGSVALGLVQIQTLGVVAGGAPEWLTAMMSVRSETFGIPVPPTLVIWLVVIIAMAIFIHRTRAGRYLQAAGANPRAARLALVKVRWIWVAVFGASAAMAAIAGVFIAGFAGTVNTTIGGPYLFQSLAAVVIGGTAFGGPGDYTRTVVGATMLTTVTTVLMGHGLGTSDQQILYGVIILAAMVFYGRGAKLRDRV
jgi:ribose transport system permease protein